MSSSLATLRVDLDGMCQRISALTERLGTAHGPALEAMQVELSKAQAQSRHEVEKDMASLRNWIEEVSDGSDEAFTEVRQVVRQVVCQATASFTHGLSSLAEQAAAKAGKEEVQQQLTKHVEAQAEALGLLMGHARASGSSMQTYRRSQLGVSRQARLGSGPP